MRDQLCGFELPDDIYIPSGSYSEVRIQFTSDEDVQYDGFAVEVIFGSTTATEAGLYLPKNKANSSFIVCAYVYVCVF